MPTPNDVVPANEAPVYSASAPRLDEDQGLASFFQEINERRAHVENSELLQHLRSL